MATTNNSDQFRKLQNFLLVSGEIIDFQRTRQDNDKNGTPYISTTCTVRIGEDKGTELVCSMYVSALTRDFNTGDNIHNKDYDTLLEYMTQVDKNKSFVAKGMEDQVVPVKACLKGSLSDNPWYDKTKKEMRKNATRNEMRGFGKYEEDGARLTLEGYIHSIADEERKEGDSSVTTGRKLVRFISKDKTKDRNTLDVRFILPEDLVEAFKDNDFDEEKTAVFNVSYQTVVREKKTAHGFGQTPGSGSFTNLERVIVGGNLVEKEENEITPAQVKTLLKERELRCAQIEKEGKEGGDTATSTAASASSTRGTFGNTKPASGVNEGFQTSDDDMAW